MNSICMYITSVLDVLGYLVLVMCVWVCMCIRIYIYMWLNQSTLLKHICVMWQVLKPGKCVLFRDYGLYDHAMLRFKSGSKLGENFYVRQDGTRSYFFTEGKIYCRAFSFLGIFCLNLLQGIANMPILLHRWTVKSWCTSFAILFGRKRVFRLAGLFGALSNLQASCMCYNVPRAAVSEFAEFHSDLLSKGKRPMFNNRIDHLHETAKQLSWHRSFHKAIPGVQDEVYWRSQWLLRQNHDYSVEKLVYKSCWDSTDELWSLCLLVFSKDDAKNISMWYSIWTVFRSVLVML